MKGNQEQSYFYLRKLKWGGGGLGRAVCPAAQAGREQRPENSLCPVDWALQRLWIPLSMVGRSQMNVRREASRSLQRWKHPTPSQCGLAQKHDGRWENGRESALANQLTALLESAKMHRHPNWCQDCYSGNYNYVLSTRDTQVTDVITQFDNTGCPELSF